MYILIGPWTHFSLPQRAFYELFDEAKSKVEEPPQPKIRLRAPSAQAQSTGSAKPKRITIHVGGGREDSQGSPAPGPSGEAVATPNGINGAAARPAAVNPSVANANQDRGALATPGQAVKREDSVRQSPGMPPQISNSYISSAFTVMPQSANGYGQMANGHATAGSPPAPKSAWDQQFRDPSTSQCNSSFIVTQHTNNYGRSERRHPQQPVCEDPDVGQQSR